MVGLSSFKLEVPGSNPTVVNSFSFFLTTILPIQRHKYML